MVGSRSSHRAIAKTSSTITIGMLTCLVFPDCHLGLNLDSLGGSTGLAFDMALVLEYIYYSSLPVRSSLGENRLETSYAAGLIWEREKALNNFPLTDTSIKLQSAPVGAMPGV